MNRIALTLIALMSLSSAIAQAPMPAKPASEILHDIKRLQVTGKVLYMAAHPDDENQRVIGWLGRGEGLETGYLALTRGDGGQNLIGNEKGPSLGLLRTQELLGARRIDGGKQFFTRAYDFGYSKTPEETLTKWDKEAILGDVVWVIRNFRPDVIITRFATPEKGGGGHGHHTTSAILAHEAFDLAGDPNAFPEQLEYVEPWQPKRLFWNNYWVFRRYEPSEEEMRGIFPIQIGEFDPLLGKTYGEIAMEARSMHKCQAFGAPLIRGGLKEYLELEKGDIPEEGNFMSGIDMTWGRYGLPEADALLEEIITKFDALDPAASVPALLELRGMLNGGLANKAGKSEDLLEARADLDQIILYAAGIWMEINSPAAIYTPGQEIDFQFEIAKRTDLEIELSSILVDSWKNEQLDLVSYDTLLPVRDVSRFELMVPIEASDISQPYWLSDPAPAGVFTVSDETLIGLPENQGIRQFMVDLVIEGETLRVPISSRHRYVDRAVGELYRPIVVAPPLSVTVSEPVYLFGNASDKEVLMVARGHSAGTYTVQVEVPEGWTATPSNIEITIEEAGEELPLSVMITPPSESSVGDLSLNISGGDMEGSWSLGYQEIAYSHIPTQVWFPQARTRLARVSLEKKGNLVGYLMGSGDQVPEALEQLGYTVEMINPNTVTAEVLSKYDAVVCGIRAYNTIDRISYIQDQILAYVEAGGTYIVQYQTSYSIKEENPGPYPLSLSRGRISVEEAELTFLEPDHPALTSPNVLTEEDFEGWVQERGLYFAGEWDEQYTPLLAGHDPGEDDLEGALLVARYGQGWYVYTGLSFFRELPAGVPGAFRLFVNLISLGQEM